MRQDKITTDEQIARLRREIAEELKIERGGRVALTGAQRVKRALNISGQVLFAALFAALAVSLASVYQAKLKGEVPRVFGAYSLFVVESGSMEPTLTVGSVIVSRQPRNPAALKAGDVVTFHTSAGDVVTHRIIEVVAGESVSYRTKGDNLANSPDEELLAPERVIGVLVFKIPFT